MLQAANGSDIHAYGHRSLTLDLCVNRRLHWVVIVANVPYRTIGVDILQHSDPLVDARHRKVVDRQTPLTVAGSYAVVNQITPQYAKPTTKQPFNWLLRD